MSNPVVKFQILAPDTGRLAAFYASLFGWETTRDNLLQYQAIDTGSERGIHGGLWPSPPESVGFVQLFIEVADCAVYAANAVALGASMLIPPQSLPDGDTVAILKDPAGISFGIVTPGHR